MSTDNLNSTKQELNDFSGILSSYKTEVWSSFPGIDLYMDQVVTYLEKLLNTFNDDDKNKVITSSMVNNYVKEGYLKRPVNKKYDRVHLVSLYIMSMLKPILPISLIAGSLQNFENEQKYRIFFEEFTTMQDEAFNNVSHKLAAALNQITDDKDYETALRLFALQLTSEANAHRIAAEKILETLNKNNNSAKISDKEKNK
ncbi:uncharacterized protein DUF1836 [Ruminiclostridium sufflavum DSM 19573]|uniref:Uncharacterized protein DUF1836 n=1 Tax=Ruminiclostridium sufflavum DSM 19573 TaxID=1121337 RepID=A0A318XK68_9FIRM|nr:DUF1836 domain-containing protein [Ruminiclostridium sufflavum]PYG85817.1 uncharacterized protein DUF1836 [Ruminiclostridium sufflavum DSM 19573]